MVNYNILIFGSIQTSYFITLFVFIGNQDVTEIVTTDFANEAYVAAEAIYEGVEI